LPFCSITLTAQKPSNIPQNPKTLGDHIKKRRLELGLYQGQVAKILGVTECTITNWEKNRSNPTLRLMPKIIEFLGYDRISVVPKTLGEKLFQYRKSHGLNQKHLAKMIGIDPATLSRVERGRTDSSAGIKDKISKFLLQNLTQKDTN
jgi:transcriptional regulator with XRE-family HTH domain